MKKIVSILILLLCMVSMQAEEHLKFMGIPLNGTINQFQVKLQAKGFVKNSLLNKNTPVGTRVFSGTFIGKKSIVPVYYDADTKVVYGAKVYFDGYTESEVENEIAHMKQLLLGKYDEADIREGVKTGLSCFIIETEMGSIFVYAMKDEYELRYPYIYSVHLEYNDNKNSKKHHNQIMDDL